MSRNSFQPWLDEQALAEGVLAAAVRVTNRVIETVSRSPEFPVAALAEFFPVIAEIQRMFDHQKLLATWQSWDFQSARVVFSERPDGALLVLLLAPEMPAGRLDEWVASFQSWEPKAAT